MKKVFILGAVIIASMSFAKSTLPTKVNVLKENLKEVKVKPETKAKVEVKTYVIDVPNKCGTISRVLLMQMLKLLLDKWQLLHL